MNLSFCRGAALAAVAVFPMICANSAFAQVQTPIQEACIVRLNKEAAKLGKTVGKEAGKCLKSAASNTLFAGQSADECLTADNKGRLTKARGKLLTTEGKYCLQNNIPDFGYAGGSAVNDAVLAEVVGLVGDFFGPLDAATVLRAFDADGAKCQSQILKAALKVLDNKFKVFLRCKDQRLGANLVTSGEELESCFDEVVNDEKSRIGKSLVKMAGVLVDCVGDGLDLGEMLPGVCAAAESMTTCLDTQIECRFCSLMNLADDITENCDRFDNGVIDFSCSNFGETTTTTTSTTLPPSTTTVTTTTTQTTTTTLPALTCGNSIVDPGEACDDGNVLPGDCCSATCQFEGNGSACASDGNVCTNDVCDGAGTCLNVNNTIPCDDGAFCNGADTCSGGACSVHAGDPCASGSECQNICNEDADHCFGVGPSIPAPNLSMPTPNLTTCSGDGNECTDDVCDGAGVCIHIANNAPCDDGIFCNGADSCANEACTSHPGDPCPGADGDSDCSESCDEGAGACVANDPDTASCDDGLFCTANDTCSAGTCIGSGDPCSGPDADSNCNESCNEAADNCLAQDDDGSTCDDGIFCTFTDTCSGGVCSGTGNTCSSGGGALPASSCSDECTNNPSATSCNETGTACNDGQFCTTGDTCSAGTCVGGGGDPCPGADGDDDCSEQCNEASDNCSSTDPNGSACDDGNPATGPDTCVNGTCQSGPVLPCAQRSHCIIFVTNSSSDGNIGTGGLAGADTICNSQASAAGLGGNFQAWLCDGSTAPADRSTRSSTAPYRRADGALIANNWADLTDGSIANPINVHANGAGVGGIPFLPWTYVRTNGTCDDETYLSPGSGPCPAFSNCKTNCDNNSNGQSGWDSGSGWVQGSKGDVNATNGNWTDGATGLCSTPSERHYCIEQ